VRPGGLFLFGIAFGVLAVGCGRAPGYPPNPMMRPTQIGDFATLYSRNCAACHGSNGRNGAAIDLANPEYQALVDDAALRKWISGGMPGTEMTAFAQSEGGMLTAAQIDALVAGMRKQWWRPNAFGGLTPPPYAQPANGDSAHGQQVYVDRCAHCHQAQYQDITSPGYLALVSDQALRSIIIAGRPDIGQMDWRMERGPAGVAGQLSSNSSSEFVHPLSAQDVTDIVAYLDRLRNASSTAQKTNTAPALSGQTGR